MKAKSIQGKSPEEIRKAIKETIAKDFKPTLGIVFLSIYQDREKVNSILDESGINVYGATTNGEFTIDGVTALEMTRKYSGIENLTKENEKVIMDIATMFPIQLQREKGNPVMRPGLVVNWDDGSFFTSGTVPQGSKVRFSLPPDFDVIDKVIEEANELKEKEMPDPDAVIVYSCAGRLMTFGPLISKEIDGINEVWNAPMVGMFSNAELARATGGNLEMHNLTCCNVVLKEK